MTTRHKHFLRIAASAILLLSAATPAIAAQERFVAAVIDNSSRAQQYQQGIEDAHIVFESLVSADEKHVLPFFTESALPTVLGPLSKTHSLLNELASSYSSLLLHGGGDTEGVANARIRLDPTQRYPHPPPHNVFTRRERIQSLLRSARTVPRMAVPLYTFARPSEQYKDAPAGLIEIVGATVADTIHFKYDPKHRTYTRTVRGERLRAHPKNIVVIASQTGEVTGEGDLLHFARGHVQEGRWARTSGRRFAFTDAEGNPLSFAPGPIWIVLTADGQQVSWNSAVRHHLSSAGNTMITTDDTTPLLIIHLEPQQVYDVMVRNYDGHIIMRSTDAANDEGILLYSIDQELDKGKYRVFVRNSIGDQIETYVIKVTEEQEQSLPWVISFGKKPDKLIRAERSDKYLVGGIERSDGQVIQGYVEPGDDVFVYFQSETRVESAQADERGYFEIPIPLSLPLGEHTARLVRAASTNSFSREMVFSFALLPGTYEAVNYDRLHGIAFTKKSMIPYAIPLFAIALLIFGFSFAHVRHGRLPRLARPVKDAFKKTAL